MRTGTKISAVGHGVAIALALFGLPWMRAPERDPVRVTEVSFISEADFERAQAAAPAEAPRAEEAPAAPPRSRPPEPEPEVSEAPPEAPDVTMLQPAAPEVPDTGRITPRIVTLEPPTAAAPPRERPAPRVEPNPAPPPPEPVRAAETPTPATAPNPETELARVEETPQAPPEATPEPIVEEVPPAPLALATAAPPPPRPKRAASDEAEPQRVMAALRREVEREVARRVAAATPATPATEPAVTPPSEPATEATSLPVGPPLTSGEREGLRLAVQRCWNVPAGLRDAQELKVTLAAELAANGEVINASIRLLEPSPAPDARFQQAYEAGRRALIRCSPYADLPRDKYAQWRQIEVVFNPEGMVSW